MDRRQGNRASDQAPARSSSLTAAPSLAGRAGEMRRIVAALERAARGQGGTVFLTGEAGIGKTRLGHEALAEARARRFLVIEGRAYPLEAGLAYAPVIDAFGPLLRGLDAARQAALVSGLPDLGRLFGGLRLPAPEPLGDPALEKTRLFEAVSRLLERLAQEKPIALLVDDLHWADPASLELLHYVARGLADQPVLLLATYHVHTLETTRGLRALVRSLQRVGLAEEMVVQRLEADAVATLASGVLGGEAPPELIELLESRAAGTPLFIEAFMTALIEAGHLVRAERGWRLRPEAAVPLPQGVRNLIIERLERLEPTERRVVELIALMGQAAPHAVLRAVSVMDEEALLMALRRLRAARLVAEEIIGQDVAYSITHPLIQEVAYAELPEMARRRAHAAAAAAFEQLRPDDPSLRSGQALERLARHYKGAGPEADRDRALAVLLAAAERARELYANDEAARHFGAALTLVREGGGAAHSHARLPWLLERLGEAWERVGEVGAAVAVWSEALSEHERGGEATAIARLRRMLAMAEWERGHFDAAQSHLAVGLAALADHEPCQELADLHYARWAISSRLGDKAGIAAATVELKALAEQLGSPAAAAEAHRAAAGWQLWQGNTAAARESALRGLKAAEEANDQILIYRSHDAVALTGLRAGDHCLIRHHGEAGLSLAQLLGAPTLEVQPSQRLVYADFLSGRWDEALQRSKETVALARRVGQHRGEVYVLAARAIVLVHRGELVEAEICLSEARAAFGSGSPADRHVFGGVDMAEVALALAQGQGARAHGIAAGFDHTPGSRATTARITAAGLPMGLALLAEAQVAAGEAESALGTAGELAALGKGGAPFAAALAARAEGLARQALGETEEALTCLRRAAEAFGALEMPFEVARCNLEWATLAGAAQPAATAIAQESLAVFERLGARPYAERAKRVLRDLGVSAPAIRRPRPTNGLLSARELEVARLVAEGLTTAEIAERLILSPRTVTTHLDHIYARLGIGSRAALARYVVEAGLLQTKDKNT